MQRLDQSGSGHIGVQIDGDSNTVTICAGTARLTLALRHKAQRPPTKDLDLLDPYRCPIDLVGRADDLKSLQARLAGPAPIAVQCRIGRAGSGKTRLAIELCRRAEAQGWTTGFLRHGELVRFQRDGHVRGWDWPEPTLVVVDYAATSARALRHWLEDLADRDPAGRPPLRLLLLERHASSDAGWWSELTRFAGFSAASIEDLLDPPEPIELSRVSAPEERRTLLRTIMTAAAVLNGKPAPPALPEPGTDPTFDAAIARDTIELEPLYLLMAGLTAVQNNIPHVLALTRTDLAFRLAARELERIGDAAQNRGIDRTLAQHLAAFLTLVNGCTTTALPAIVSAEAAVLGHVLATGPDPVAHLLADIFTSLQPDRVDPIRPDLIGEAAILEIFKRQRRPADWQAAAVTRAYDRAGAETVATVIRTAQDFATGALDHPSLLWLDRLADHADNPDQLIAIADQLPQQTVNLRERAVAILAHIVRHLRNASPKRKAVLSASLNNLGSHLIGLGRREAALAATQEAVSVLREIATAHPDTYQPYLAGSLTNLGTIFFGLGMRQKALAATQEAVAVYRKLTAEHPGAYKHYLAGSLDNLGNALLQLGERDEAITATSEAVALYRDLAAARPAAFKPDLARSLNNLGSKLSDLGRFDAALLATREAVAIRRELAAAHSDAFKPDLASSLTNLGSDLGGLGRYEAALVASEEAVGLYRELAAARPDAFGVNFAVSLAVRADCLQALERMHDALASNAEAIEALRPTFIAHPMAVAQWMQPMCVQYLQRAEGLGVTPDDELLAPIVEVFQKLQAQAQAPGETA